MAGSGAPRRVILLLSLLACVGEPPTPPSPAPPGPPHGATSRPSQGRQADLAATRAFYGARTRAAETPLTTSVTPVAGVDGWSATGCQPCHPQIYAEWAVSTHAAAWIDPQYQQEIRKSDNRWLCLNCHTPLLDQQDRWPVALRDDDVEQPVLVDNTAFDSALRDEGITCAACHVRDGVIHGPGLGGDAPHPVQADDAYRSGALCMRCHEAQAVYPGKTFICTFQTGSEWATGGLAAERSCPDCHMPPIQRPAGTGAPVRRVGQHWWRGAGIPKVAGVHPPPQANPPGLGIEVTLSGAQLSLRLSNANAGHKLPTGDPERWVQVDVLFSDSGGAEVGRWSTRMGQVWDWSGEPRKVSDNRLAPRDSRTDLLPIPKGATRAEIIGSSHRMSQENARFHDLLGTYPISVETHRLTVPLPTL